jgi:hypothetical protein
MTKSDYKPTAQSQKILDTAWDMINSVPYKVTTRWLFYQLLQVGFYSKKDHYKNRFVPLVSRARHAFYQGWRPDTLADDRREAISRTGGHRSVKGWVSYMASGGWICELDHFYRQNYYVELWYEAQAMSRQFEHYTSGITLRPFSGMPSIDYKWTIAKDLEYLHGKYNKPIVILYFGDYDPAGLTIPETSISDIQSWCKVEFEVIRCGLNPGDETKYNIPENIDKPNCYQWEALNDQAAKGLILNSINKYIDASMVETIQVEGRKASSAFDTFVSGFADYFNSYRGGYAST